MNIVKIGTEVKKDKNIGKIIWYGGKSSDTVFVHWGDYTFRWELLKHLTFML